VGVHYLGRASRTSPWHAQLTGLTDGAIPLVSFGAITDTIHFPGFQIRMPDSYDAYEKTLGDAFAHERRGLQEYFAAIRYVRSRLQAYFTANVLPRPFTRIARHTVLRRINGLATATTEQVMSRFLRDEKLKAVLDAQWGNIGAPRGSCSFLAHAAMLGNYLENGAAYPLGGSRVFARELGRVIYRNNGAIRVKARVQRLIIRKNRVQGVCLENGEELTAPTVISSIGIFNTYHRLLRDVPSCAPAIAELQRHQPALEFLNLFIGFKQSPADFGLGDGNTWIHPRWETAHDDPSWDVRDLIANPDPGVLFFSSSSLRDPDLPSRKHNGFNGQIITASRFGAFDAFKHSRWRHRDEAYGAQKEQIIDRMMALLDEKHPGIRQNAAYGMAPVCDRFASLLMRPTTPVRNLYLTGQDLTMPGVPAAIGAANMCCSLILRRNAGAEWQKRGERG
jgi:all-trans-retinol 13,14-reductase